MQSGRNGLSELEWGVGYFNRLGPENMLVWTEITLQNPKCPALVRKNIMRWPVFVQLQYCTSILDTGEKCENGKFWKFLAKNKLKMAETVSNVIFIIVNWKWILQQCYKLYAVVYAVKCKPFSGISIKDIGKIKEKEFKDFFAKG